MREYRFTIDLILDSHSIQISIAEYNSRLRLLLGMHAGSYSMRLYQDLHYLSLSLNSKSYQDSVVECLSCCENASSS